MGRARRLGRSALERSEVAREALNVARERLALRARLAHLAVARLGCLLERADFAVALPFRRCVLRRTRLELRAAGRAAAVACKATDFDYERPYPRPDRCGQMFDPGRPRQRSRQRRTAVRSKRLEWPESHRSISAALTQATGARAAAHRLDVGAQRGALGLDARELLLQRRDGAPHAARNGVSCVSSLLVFERSRLGCGLELEVVLLLRLGEAESANCNGSSFVSRCSSSMDAQRSHEA